jgi:diguanylate cyclase (GGDEF)-like protein
LGEGFAGWIAQHGRAATVSNTADDPRVSIIDPDLANPASMAGAPLIYEGKVRGAITLSKAGTNQFDENALRLLEIIAAQAALVFDRARLYRQLRLEATTDPVVRLWNRRYLLERFREEQSRAVRSGQPLSCMIMDIDRFKRINDTHGHDAGDVVLRSLAALLRRLTRTEDIVARYGGEEFCILLPASSLVGTAQLAERLRAAIERHRLPEKAGVPSITVSIGLAELLPDDAATEMFTRADHAMYAAKAAGGNQVRLPADSVYT